MYLSTPLQESSDVIISGLKSELSSLNQKLEMSSYHQVTLSTMGRARSYWMAWVLPVGGGGGGGGIDPISCSLHPTLWHIIGAASAVHGIVSTN